MNSKPATLFDKVWNTHVIRKIEDGPDVLSLIVTLFIRGNPALWLFKTGARD